MHIQKKVNIHFRKKMSGEYRIGGKKGEVGGKDAYHNDTII